jgi:molybdopterin-containing oxidoreductase family iron-sulfur binding subunit
MNQRTDRPESSPGRATRSPTYWRSLKELEGGDAFQEMVAREFPSFEGIGLDEISRRRFLTLMGASLALAGVAGCGVRPALPRAIVPYTRAPEDLIPGKPLFYATAMTQGGAGVGLLVECHEGRPTKVEGNPDHPASRGATNIFHQASVLTIYDPDRSMGVTHLGQPATWDDALAALGEALKRLRPRRGAGLRILSETIVSPTLAAQADALLKEIPEARWHQYEPLANDMAFRAAKIGFDKPVDTRFDLTKADVVLSLDSNFLDFGPASLRYTADFMSGRRVRTAETTAGQASMNRLYMAETALTPTGAKADHRLAIPAREIESVARGIAAKLGAAPKLGAGPHEKWISAVAKDLDRSRGRSAVIVGERQPVAVHLLAHAINEHLGNIGGPVIRTASISPIPVDQFESLKTLLTDLDEGRVELLLIFGGNPVYTAPADLNFADRMQRAPLRFHLSLYADETSQLCHWHLPEAHYLEAWSDTRAFEGTASIAQPMILPLYQGRSAHEFVSAITDTVSSQGLEIVKSHWRTHWQQKRYGGDFEEFWEMALHDGVVPGTSLRPIDAKLLKGWEQHLESMPTTIAGELELVFQSDPTIYDGRWANNAWLQELPKPMTRLAWDNAALMSPTTAKKLGVGPGDPEHGGEHGGFNQPVIELRVGNRSMRAPAWIMPGHADGSITLYFGYGRAAAGKIGSGVGFNAYTLRTSEHPWFVSGLTVAKTADNHPLACTQQHQLMENRDMIRSASLSEYKEKPRFAAEPDKKEEREYAMRSRTPLTLYEPLAKGGHQWGMSIDLTACIGCSACVIACQAENNIAVVGKDQVLRGREMHWIRIDQYSSGPAEAPTEFHLQPVPCMHCEQAPCEYVCPTEATVHSADGLNDMVYQRCIGTRFCSNNCPYKVRRFNFLLYSDFESTRTLQFNPDVTVRSRGVMEKCSYCVQRIRAAEHSAASEGRTIFDGEILTACQAVCPASAITFGDISDRKSKVSREKDSPLQYALLTSLNTRPRTTYLAALRNPNPELEA